MKPLTTDTAWTIGGVLLVLAAAGAMYYFMFIQTAVAALPPVTKSYNVGVIGTDLRKADTQNVFLKAAKLRKPVVSSDAQADYKAEDLGKTNLNELGK
ncbi:hypothetical protein BH11PAT4_BH11PAT4_3270 [soil metagenome]